MGIAKRLLLQVQRGTIPATRANGILKELFGSRESEQDPSRANSVPIPRVDTSGSSDILGGGVEK